MISFHQANMRGDINAVDERGRRVAVIYPLLTSPRIYQVAWDIGVETK